MLRGLFAQTAFADEDMALQEAEKWRSLVPGQFDVNRIGRITTARFYTRCKAALKAGAFTYAVVRFSELG